MSAPASPSLTRDFVARLLDWPADDPAMTTRCRLLLADGLAVAVAGMHEEPGPSIAAALLVDDDATGHSTLIGHARSASIIEAARINGMAMHVLDFETMWTPANHALSPLLPAVLALAERREQRGAPAQGLRLLRAIAIGVEAQGRLRVASQQYAPGQLTFHPPGVVGPLSAALACAALLDLDVERATMAVGIAASRSAGLLVNAGSFTKALHCGDAAASGLGAALLAERDFSSNADAMSGPRGWTHAFFGSGFDAAVLTQPIAIGRALDPGPSWKLFPSQYATHFGITAALDARARLGAGFDPARIRRIDLRGPVMPYIDRPAPATGLEGKFSWQYTASLALLDGKVEVESFSAARRADPALNALLDRFHVTSDPSIGGALDTMAVDLALELDDGTRVEVRCDAPLGSPRRPVVDAVIVTKARGLLEGTLGIDRAREVLDPILETGGDFSVRDLMARLR